jgi:hypothetical protein
MRLCGRLLNLATATNYFRGIRYLSRSLTYTSLLQGNDLNNRIHKFQAQAQLVYDFSANEQHIVPLSKTYKVAPAAFACLIDSTILLRFPSQSNTHWFKEHVATVIRWPML